MAATKAPVKDPAPVEAPSDQPIPAQPAPRPKDAPRMASRSASGLTPALTPSVNPSATRLRAAIEMHGVAHALCVHRVGALEIGELAVWVGVSSGHRGEAFEACRAIIDEVKHHLPIWKKEHYVSGDSGWVNCEHCA